MPRLATPVRSLLATALLAGPALAQSDRIDPALAAYREDLHRRGIETCDQGMWKEALPIHERLTRLDPDYGFGWMGLGWSYLYLDEPEPAIPAFRRALELGALPEWRIHEMLAACFAALDRKPEARDEVKRSLDTGYPSLQRLFARRELAPLAALPEFRRLVGLFDPAGLDRPAGWRADLELLRREVKRLHYSPHRALAAAEVDAAVDAIETAIPTKDDDALGVEVAKLVRRLGDGHTVAELPSENEDAEVAAPILLGDFDDGLFVTAVARGLEDLLWARVEKIGGRTPDDVYRLLDAVVSSDNPMRLRAQGPERMRHPEILRALGVKTERDRLALGLRTRSGDIRAVELPVRRGENAWVVQPPGEERPLHARRRSEAYWFEEMPEKKAIYFQYNACMDLRSRPVAAFAQSLVDAIDAHDVAKLIVDLRWNGGGDLHTSEPLLEQLLACRKILKPGALFVIAGRHTFSAAMAFAAQLERRTPAVFVGEPTGSSPNFVGETTTLVLPWSRVTVHLSNLEWQNSYASDRRIWIAPRIRVAPLFADWMAGRDAALEAILAL